MKGSVANHYPRAPALNSMKQFSMLGVKGSKSVLLDYNIGVSYFLIVKVDQFNAYFNYFKRLRLNQIYHPLVELYKYN